MPFYAVAKGKTPGIFLTWADCEAQVKGFSGAKYKKFDSVEAAQQFITGASASTATSTFKQNSVTTPALSNNNLKRNYSTTNKKETKVSNKKSNKKSFTNLTLVDSFHENDKSSSNLSNNSTTNVSKQSTTFSDDQNYDSEESDISDDLDTILNKQMDDVEKRLKGVEKGVNKIFKIGEDKKKGSGNTKQRKTILIEPPQPKRRKSNKPEFEMDGDGYVIVYTDGACSSNGRSGARAGLGVYWGEGHALNISKPVSGRATNNCGEIQAATHAITQALENGINKLAIYTDSKFLINSVTKWMPGWKRKGWKLKSGEPVKNEVDFKELDDVQKHLALKWIYVEAHKGVHGNEMADQLAKDGAARYHN